MPIVAIVGAIRLARPSSAWARRRYPDGSRKREKAVAREAAFDARWRSKASVVQDHVAGFGA